MNRKGSSKTGFVVAGVLVLLALIGYGISHISISKKDNVTTSTVSKAESSQVGGTQQPAQTAVTEQTEATTIFANRHDVVSEAQSETQSEAQGDSSVSSEDTNSNKELEACDEPKLTGTIQETEGVVSAKKCFKNGNQTIYLVAIRLSVGTEITDLCYYCSYETYSDIMLDEKLKVKYQATEDSTYAVLGVSR